MAGADHPFSCLLLFQPLSKGRYRYIKDGGRGEELQYGMASFDLMSFCSHFLWMPAETLLEAYMSVVKKEHFLCEEMK